MKKQKHFGVFFAFLISFFISNAQLKPVGGSTFQRDVENIIRDYPNNFQHFIGDEVIANPQSVDYSSMLKISGSEESLITKYPAKKRNRYSFQAVMLTTDDFEKAKSSFYTLYTQLNNLAVHFEGARSYHLQGSYESPDEEKKFTSTLFTADPADESIKPMKVELLMEYVLLEWKIKVLVYEREREDDQRGEIKGE